MPGNTNTAFSVPLLDIHYPESTWWPKPAEPRGCQLKPWEETLKKWRIICSGTEIQARHQKALQKRAFLPSRMLLSSPWSYGFHTPKTSLTPLRCGKKHCFEREKSDVCANKRLEERNRWCWCRWCEPAGHATVTKLPSDVPTHSEILINIWRETIIDLSIDLWLLLRLAVTVTLGKRRFFYYLYIIEFY